jgi:enoyl-CoA hydratase
MTDAPEPQNDVLLVRDEGHVRVMQLNRPRRRNAFDGALTRALDAALTGLDEDRNLRVGVLTGSLEVFSAGADLKAAMAGDVPVLPGKGFGGFAKRQHSKPVIAAVEGFALGGGTELMLWCDLVVASSSARLGLPEVKRGVLAGGGGLLRLGQALPKQAAMEIALFGEQLTAQRGLELGLVNRVSEPGQALADAMVLASTLAGNSPTVVQEARALVELAQSSSEADVWEATDQANRRLRRTADAKEGPRAFLEKRDPVWSGE